jgi:single-strand DNA-binding protein
MSLNKVMIIGRLGADPERMVTGSGRSVTRFNVATSEQWKDQSGQKQERTEWHRVVVWGPQGDNCAEYLRKGRQVYVEGRIQTREWTDKEEKKRYTTEVIAQRVQFLGSKPTDERTPEFAAADQTPSFDGNQGPDDVPF